jgi:hypothetical protein
MQRGERDKVRLHLCVCKYARTETLPRTHTYAHARTHKHPPLQHSHGLASQVHEAAAKQGPEVAAAYAARHAERRFKQGDYGSAATVCAEHGVSAKPQFFEMYRSIAAGAFL